MRRLQVLMALLALMFALPAGAVTTDIQMFYPAVGEQDFLGLESGKTNRHLQLSVGLLENYSNRTLSVYSLRGNNDTRYLTSVVKHRLDSNLLLNIGLFDRLDVGMVLPVVIQGRIYRNKTKNLGLSLAKDDPLIRQGSFQLRGKLKILSVDNLFALALAANVALPTGKKHTLTRDRYIVPTLKLASSLHFDSVSLGANIGYRYRYKGSRIYNIKLKNQLVYGAAAALHIAENLDVIVETRGLLPSRKLNFTKREKYVNAAINNTRNPIEADLGLRVRFGEGWSALVGGGTGMRYGYGAPRLRAILGISWHQPPDPEPPVEPLDDDWDKDGIINDRDMCPWDPEDFDGFEDLDGCPDLDNDKDTLPDVDDMCPNLYEKDPDDGCPSLILINNRMYVEQDIKFAFDSAEIDVESDKILDEVAHVLMHLVDVKLIVVEGHTDNKGTEEYNESLSDRRSKAVREALILRGIPEDKIDSKGFGETNPVATNETAKGRKANRRVEFLIIN